MPSFITLIAALSSLVLCIAFFVLVSRAGKAVDYLEKLYTFEKLRMFRDGYIDKSSQFVGWGLNDQNEIVEVPPKDKDA